MSNKVFLTNIVPSISHCQLPCCLQNKTLIKGCAYVYFSRPRASGVAAKIMNRSVVGNVSYKCRVDCRKLPSSDVSDEGMYFSNEFL